VVFKFLAKAIGQRIASVYRDHITRTRSGHLATH
jgi:hypothetical protein